MIPINNNTPSQVIDEFISGILVFPSEKPEEASQNQPSSLVRLEELPISNPDAQRLSRGGLASAFPPDSIFQNDSSSCNSDLLISGSKQLSQENPSQSSSSSSSGTTTLAHFLEKEGTLPKSDVDLSRKSNNKFSGKKRKEIEKENEKFKNDLKAARKFFAEFPAILPKKQRDEFREGEKEIDDNRNTWSAIKFRKKNKSFKEKRRRVEKQVQEIALFKAYQKLQQENDGLRQELQKIITTAQLITPNRPI